MFFFSYLRAAAFWQFMKLLCLMMYNRLVYGRLHRLVHHLTSDTGCFIYFLTGHACCPTGSKWENTHKQIRRSKICLFRLVIYKTKYPILFITRKWTDVVLQLVTFRYAFVHISRCQTCKNIKFSFLNQCLAFHSICLKISISVHSKNICTS